jgi:hypothetical protein
MPCGTIHASGTCSVVSDFPNSWQSPDRIDSHDIARAAGRNELGRYRVDEIEEVIRPHGVDVNWRRIEVIMHRTVRRASAGGGAKRPAALAGSEARTPGTPGTPEGLAVRIVRFSITASSSSAADYFFGSSPPAHAMNHHLPFSFRRMSV